MQPTSKDEASKPSQDRVEEYHEKLRKRVVSVLSSSETEKKKQLPSLGREFLRAAERGIPATIKIFLEEGMPINYQDPATKETVLHIAAAVRAREVIRLLLSYGSCDFLSRDKQGRLASELAYLFGHDPALARLLGNKERKQAEEQGIKLNMRE